MAGWADFKSAGEARTALAARGFTSSFQNRYVKGWETWNARQQPASARQTLSRGVKTAWERAIAQYGPEGGYGKGVEAGLERGRVKAVSSGMQSLVSSGLAGTTMAAGIGKKFEEEVADPARARVEETRAQAIANLEAAYGEAQQRGYETAEDRALRERLSTQQSSSQLAVTGMQTRLGYEQIESRERIAEEQRLAQEMANRERQRQQERLRLPSGDVGGGYGNYPSPYQTGGSTKTTSNDRVSIY